MTALNRFTLPLNISNNSGRCCTNRFEFDASYHAKVLLSSPFTVYLKYRSVDNSNYHPEVDCLELNRILSFGSAGVDKKCFGQWMTWRDLKFKRQNHHHQDGDNMEQEEEEILLVDYFRSNMFIKNNNKNEEEEEENIQEMINHLKLLNDALLICEFSIGGGDSSAVGGESTTTTTMDICLSFLDHSTELVLKNMASSFQVVEQDMLFYEQYGRCGLVLEDHQWDEYFMDVLVSNHDGGGDGSGRREWSVMNRSYDWKLIELRNSQSKYIFVTPKLESGKEYLFKLIIIPKNNTWIYYDLGELYPKSILSSGILPKVVTVSEEKQVSSTTTTGDGLGGGSGGILSTIHPNMFHLKFDNYPLFHIGCTIVKSPSFQYELSPMLQVIVEASVIKKYEDPVWREITLIGHEQNSEQLKASLIDPKSSYKIRLFIACKFDRFRHGNILPKSHPITVPSSFMMWSEIPHVGELSLGYDTLLRLTNKTPLFFVFLPQDDYSKLYDFKIQARKKSALLSSSSSSLSDNWISLDMEPIIDAFQLQKMQANVVKCSSKYNNSQLEYGKSYSIRITASYNNCTSITVKEFNKTIPTFNYIPFTTDILERNGGLLIFKHETYHVYLMLNGTIILLDPTIQSQWNETRMYTGTFSFCNMISENELRKFYHHQSSWSPHHMENLTNDDHHHSLNVSQWKFITSVDTTFDHHPPHDLRLPKQTFNYCFHIFFDGKQYRLIDTSQLFSDSIQQLFNFNWKNEEFTNVILMDCCSHSSQSDEKHTCGPIKSNQYPQRVIQWVSNCYFTDSMLNNRELCDLSFNMVGD